MGSWRSASGISADFLQAQFLALVQVGGAGQRQHQQGRGAGPAQAEFDVELLGRGAGQQPALAVLALGVPAAALGQAVAGGVPDDVVVGEDPGGGGAGFAWPRRGCG